MKKYTGHSLNYKSFNIFLLALKTSAEMEDSISYFFLWLRVSQCQEKKIEKQEDSRGEISAVETMLRTKLMSGLTEFFQRALEKKYTKS